MKTITIMVIVVKLGPLASDRRGRRSPGPFLNASLAQAVKIL
jgi:hypothetical protein